MSSVTGPVRIQTSFEFQIIFFSVFFKIKLKRMEYHLHCKMLVDPSAGP
jgi:hypothetical protein